MAAALFQQSFTLRFSIPCTQKRPLYGGVAGPRFDSSNPVAALSLSGDEALEAQVRSENTQSSAFVRIPEGILETSESDIEEPSTITQDFRDDGANEPLTAATSLVPGTAYERLKINLDLLLYKAKRAQRFRKKNIAEAIYRECIRDWPDDGRAYVALGKLLEKYGKIQQARKLYEDACQAARGENPYIWQVWAVLEEKTGNLSKARSLFDAATVADKKHAAAWHGWAVLELRNGNLRKAKNLLLKGIKNCGQNEYLYQTLAIIEAREGNIDQARSYFAKSTQVNPKSAACWLAWALMEAECGVKDSVRRLFQRGLQAFPRSGHIWQAWARFEAKEGNRGRARELFQRGMELNPQDVVILQAYALFEYDCGQPDIARRYFRRAVLIDAKHQPLWLAWGWVEWKEGNLDAARDYYQKSLTISNRNTNAVWTYQAWGVLESKAGNYGAARALFRSSLRLDSQNMPTWLSWATMEEECGNSVRADELRNQCLQQRTEVVEGVTWDMNISEFFAPTIEGLTGFLDKDKAKQNKEVNTNNMINEDENTKWGTGDDFDIDSFLQENFPWRYKKNKLSNTKANVASRT